MSFADEIFNKMRNFEGLPPDGTIPPPPPDSCDAHFRRGFYAALALIQRAVTGDVVAGYSLVQLAPDPRSMDMSALFTRWYEIWDGHWPAQPPHDGDFGGQDDVC